MAASSSMLPLGTPAPDFELPDTSGTTVRLAEVRAGAPGVVVAFVCNHCPYVRHMAERFGALARDWADLGVATVAISSNDATAYPDDSPERMAEQRLEWGWELPYLYDESQEVARAYGAACTPDLFLFDAAGELAYRGQFDASRPGNDEPVTGADLDAAVRAVAAGRRPPADQTPSIGCSIKWRA
jgi:peroxiredoxin